MLTHWHAWDALANRCRRLFYWIGFYFQIPNRKNSFKNVEKNILHFPHFWNRQKSVDKKYRQKGVDKKEVLISTIRQNHTKGLRWRVISAGERRRRAQLARSNLMSSPLMCEHLQIWSQIADATASTCESVRRGDSIFIRGSPTLCSKIGTFRDGFVSQLSQHSEMRFPSFFF